MKKWVSITLSVAFDILMAVILAGLLIFVLSILVKGGTGIR